MSATWILIECLTIGALGATLGFMIGAQHTKNKVVYGFDCLSAETLALIYRDLKRARALRKGKP